MKAKIKATGEIVTLKNLYTDGTAIDTNGRYYRQGDISEFIEESNHSIDWEQRRYELAKEAMGAFIASPSYRFQSDCNYYESQVCATADIVARDAVNYADALISKLRETPPKDEFSSIVEQAPNLHKALEEIVSLPIPEPITWEAFSDRVRDIAISAIGKCK